MKHIDTTHVGSLPRSNELAAMLIARDKGEPVDPAAFDALVKPDKTLIYSPLEVDENRRAWIDEWLNATAQ